MAKAKTKTKKVISRDDYLKAFALFTMAAQHSDESNRYVEGLKKIIGGECDHCFDEIYGYNSHNFDAALEKEGVVVRKGTRR